MLRVNLCGSQGSEWMYCSCVMPTAPPPHMWRLAPFPPSPWIRFLTSQTPLQPPLLQLQIEELILSAAPHPSLQTQSRSSAFFCLCGGWSEKGSAGPRLPTWALVYETAWKGLGGVALLQEVYQWGWYTPLTSGRGSRSREAETGGFF